MWITHSMTLRFLLFNSRRKSPSSSALQRRTESVFVVHATSNLAQNFTPDILILENSADELNVIKVK